MPKKVPKKKKRTRIPQSPRSSITSKTQKIKSSDEYDSPQPFSRFDVERLNRFIVQLIKSNEVKDPEELNYLIEEALTFETWEEIFDSVEFSDIEIAQELAYQAMESRDRKEALRLANEALKLDPDCIDALVMKAVVEAKSVSKLIEKLKKIIAKAEKNFGPDYFKGRERDFWAIVESKPYMRALRMLILFLRAEGRVGESVLVAERMLDLNPRDIEGIRYTLLGLYLETGNLAGAQRLFREYPDDEGAVFNWGQILERYLAGDMEKAALVLKKAISQNPYVLDYLIGRKRVPNEIFDDNSVDEESEAIECWEELGVAWEGYPDALKWLKFFAQEAGW